MGNEYIQLSNDPLSLNLLTFGSDSGLYGACNAFIGRVREQEGPRRVRGLHYDAYDPLVIQSFECIIQNCKNKWMEPITIHIHHRKGWVEAGQISLILVVYSIHRKTSFDACQWVLEEIKRSTPIWKKQFYEDEFMDNCRGIKIPNDDSAMEALNNKETLFPKMGSRDHSGEWLKGQSLRIKDENSIVRDQLGPTDHVVKDKNI